MGLGYLCRRNLKYSHASLSRLVCIWSFMLQLTTVGLNRSMTAAKYTQPSSVAM